MVRPATCSAPWHIRRASLDRSRSRSGRRSCPWRWRCGARRSHLGPRRHLRPLRRCSRPLELRLGTRCHLGLRPRGHLWPLELRLRPRRRLRRTLELGLRPLNLRTRGRLRSRFGPLELRPRLTGRPFRTARSCRRARWSGNPWLRRSWLNRWPRKAGPAIRTTVTPSGSALLSRLRAGCPGRRQRTRQRPTARPSSRSGSLPWQHIVRTKIPGPDNARLHLTRLHLSRTTRTARSRQNARRCGNLALIDQIRAPCRRRWQRRRKCGTGRRDATWSGARTSRPELTALPEPAAGPARSDCSGRRTPVDDGVDDLPVVDVREQETVHRRTHIDRRPDEDRDRNKHRLRQVVRIRVVDRRIEHDEVFRRRRQEEDRRRRRRRERKRRIVEHQVRPVDILVFVFRRRRHIIGVRVEARRRLQRGSDIGEPAARVGRMRTARIALQIGPVGLLRVRAIGLPPCDRLAARGDDRPHPLCHRIVRIGREKGFIVGNGVAFERRRVSLLRAEIANGLRARSGVLIGLKRRSVRRALEEDEIAFELLRIPRHLRALGHVIHAQSHAVEYFRRYASSPPAPAHRGRSCRWSSAPPCPARR